MRQAVSLDQVRLMNDGGRVRQTKKTIPAGRRAVFSGRALTQRLYGCTGDVFWGFGPVRKITELCGHDEQEIPPTGLFAVETI